MGDPAKKRKQYETPRKKWNKTLLETEKKIVSEYGLKNKRELRRAGTWLKNKRDIAKSLLALPLEKRLQRETELGGGLKKIGLTNDNSTLDDVLSLKVEELLEKRLQTIVFKKKDFANTVKQARQFVVHGHIAIGGKKVDAPGYVVRTSEVAEVGWYRKPLKVKEEKAKKDLKREFEESSGEAAAEAKPAEAAKHGVKAGEAGQKQEEVSEGKGKYEAEAEN